MARSTAWGGFARPDVEWILSGHSRLTCEGTAVWLDENSNYCIRLPATATGFGAGDLAFTLRLGKKRASEPTLLLKLRNECILRLDVNGNHQQGLTRYVGATHLHTRYEPGGPEAFVLSPPGVPAVPLGRRVGDATYFQLFQGFADLSSMDISGVTWVNAPEGRHP